MRIDDLKQIEKDYPGHRFIVLTTSGVYYEGELTADISVVRVERGEERSEPTYIAVEHIVAVVPYKA